MKGISIAGRKRNDGIDFYSTPEWATEALMKREEFSGAIWDCACGNGRMAKVIKKYNICFSSDIRIDDDVYGKKGIDFLLVDRRRFNNNIHNIVTNPPFVYAQQFVEKAKQFNIDKVAMFLKLVFLESERRYNLFKDRVFPLKKVLVFCHRPQLYPEGTEKPKNSGTIAYAWFIWDREYSGSPIIDWINDR